MTDVSDRDPILQWIRANPARLAVAIVLLTLLVRVTFIAIVEIRPVSDYATYKYMATSLYEEGQVIDPMGNHAFYNSGYPFAISEIYFLFGKGDIKVQFFNALLGTLSVFLAYLIGAAIARDPAVGLVSAALLATYPPAIVYTEYFAKENMMIPLILACLSGLHPHPLVAPHRGYDGLP